VIGDLALLDVYARVARILREAGAEAGGAGGRGLLIRSGRPSGEIAGLIGTSRETVSRA
jgi:hypothetical protein